SLRSRKNKRPTAALAPEARLAFAGCSFAMMVLLPSFAAPQARNCSNTLSVSGGHLERPVGTGFQAVPRQVRDGARGEAVRLAEPDEVRHPSHGAVVVDDLADHAGGVQAGEAGEIDRRLGLSAALEHAAGAGAQREHVAGPGEVVRGASGVRGGA